MTNKSKQNQKKGENIFIPVQTPTGLHFKQPKLYGLAGSVHDWQKETGRCTKI